MLTLVAIEHDVDQVEIYGLKLLCASMFCVIGGDTNSLGDPNGLHKFCHRYANQRMTEIQIIQ